MMSENFIWDDVGKNVFLSKFINVKEWGFQFMQSKIVKCVYKKILCS